MITQPRKLFQQVRIINPLSNIDTITDVLIQEDKIQQIAPNLQLNEQQGQIIDGTGLVLAPGLVDLYSSSGEPGNEERDTLASLAESAIAGGFTRGAILPNTNPVIDNPAVCNLIHSRLSQYTTTKFYLWGALTQNLQGETMAELGDLAESAVIGFTDNKAHKNLQLVRKLLEYAHPFNLPVALVPSDVQLQGKGVMREGETSIRLGLLGIPAIAETIAISAIVELVALTQTPVHLMRISTARGVELIRQAKEQDLPITASVNWHHLLLHTETIASYNPNLRFNPPLGTETDKQALIQGVKTGVIDAIAIDHIGYTYEEKTVAFAEAPNGAIGLQIALPLLWQNLVVTGELTALELWQSLSVNPLKCLQQKPINLAEGETAELILFSPQKSWQVNSSNLKSLSQNTYWLNKEIKGEVHTLLLNPNSFFNKLIDFSPI